MASNGSSKNVHKVVILQGDGIGPEVTGEAVKVLQAIQASPSSSVEFDLQYHDFGGIAIDNHGDPLPASTLDACRKSDAIILGAVGGPKWGVGKVRPEQGILRLRKELDLYANIRPALFPSESLLEKSPLKEHIVKGCEIIVFRELVSGIYFGERTESTPDSDVPAEDKCTYSASEIRRIARLAGQMASGASPPLAVHSIDKANVLATSRLWRATVTQVFADEFPHIKLDHQLVDSAAMLLASNPRKLNGIVLTDNLFGDILSDEASVIPGSLGLLPSASLAGLPDGKERLPGVYEPIHGSAPDIAGQGIANPVGTILSVAMMLRYTFALEKEAKAVEDAVRKVLDATDAGGKGLWTRDLGGSTSTSEMGDAIVEVLKGLL